MTFVAQSAMLSADTETGLEKEPQFLLPIVARDGSMQFTVPDTGTNEADFAFSSKESGRSK